MVDAATDNGSNDEAEPSLSLSKMIKSRAPQAVR